MPRQKIEILLPVNRKKNAHFTNTGILIEQMLNHEYIFAT
jgi:hypothetical protein